MSKTFNVAIVGATGAVGQAMLDILAERKFPVSSVHALAQANIALEETNEAVLELGGIPWKAEVPAQEQIVSRMDPDTFSLMNRLRKLLDPKGIMNPGNWDADWEAS